MFIWNSWKFSLPDDVYVKSLERCHAATIYSNWLYKASTTIGHVEEEIDRMPSAGLFLKETDELVCMIMGRPPNGMSRLFTLDEYRGRGYARLVIQYISKRMAQSGYLPFANVIAHNESSIKCFRHLGFRHHRNICILEVTRNSFEWIWRLINKFRHFNTNVPSLPVTIPFLGQFELRAVDWRHSHVTSFLYSYTDSSTFTRSEGAFFVSLNLQH